MIAIYWLVFNKTTVFLKVMTYICHTCEYLTSSHSCHKFEMTNSFSLYVKTYNHCFTL